ncbi:MAG: hypothetical protein ABIO70_02370 [Pseudomonadota bacterium]
MAQWLSMVSILLVLVACGPPPAPPPPARTYSEMLSSSDDPCEQLIPTRDRAMERNPEAFACLEQRCAVWLDGLDPARPEDLAELRLHCNRALGTDDRARVLPCAAAACGRLVAEEPGVALAAASRVTEGAARLREGNLWRATGVYGALVASDERLSEVLALARPRPCGEQAALLEAMEPVLALRGQPVDGARTWAGFVALVGQGDATGDACGRVDELALRLADRLDHGATAAFVARLWAEPGAGSRPLRGVEVLLSRWIRGGALLPDPAAGLLLQACREDSGDRREHLCRDLADGGLGWRPPAPADPGVAPWAPQPPLEVGPLPAWLRDVEIPASPTPGANGACAALAAIRQEGRGAEACLQHLAHDPGALLAGLEDANRRYCLDQLCLRAVHGEPRLALDALELLRLAPADMASQSLLEAMLAVAYHGPPEGLQALFAAAGERACGSLGVLLAHPHGILAGPGWLRGPAGEDALGLVQHASRDCASPVEALDWLEEIAGLDAGEALGRIEEGEGFDPALRAAALRRLQERGDADGRSTGRKYKTREEKMAEVLAYCERVREGTAMASLCDHLRAMSK